LSGHSITSITTLRPIIESISAIIKKPLNIRTSNMTSNQSENEIVNTVKKYASCADDALQGGKENVKDKFRNYPLTSVVVALSIGLTLGFIIGRK